MRLGGRDQAAVKFISAILNGQSGKAGIKGSNDHETHQMKAEWMVRSMPKTASMIGIEWDGIKRLQGRK